MKVKSSAYFVATEFVGVAIPVEVAAQTVTTTTAPSGLSKPSNNYEARFRSNQRFSSSQ